MSEGDMECSSSSDSELDSVQRLEKGDDTVADLMRHEGRETVDNLNDGLGDIDTKASKLMRTNIVLTGLLLSGFSFASNSDSIDASPFVNSFSISGITVLVTSVVAAGVTYTASESRVGVSPATIREFVNAGLERDEAERGVAKAYARWIEINRRANVKNAFYISITVLLVLVSVILLSTAVFVGAFSDVLSASSRIAIWLVVLASIVTVGWIADVKGDYEEWREYE